MILTITNKKFKNSNLKFKQFVKAKTATTVIIEKSFEFDTKFSPIIQKIF